MLGENINTRKREKSKKRKNVLLSCVGMTLVSQKKPANVPNNT